MVVHSIGIVPENTSFVKPLVFTVPDCVLLFTEAHLMLDL